MSTTPLPPLTRPQDLQSRLASAGFAVLDAQALGALTGLEAGSFAALAPFWGALPPDAHLRDGGRYRRRRHGCFVIDGEGIEAVAQRPHWQPVEYNALHGGIQRWFDPLEPAFGESAALRALLHALANVAEGLHPGNARWYVEVHPFRIDCEGGIGRPTPEGAHRDGVDLVAVLLVARHNVKGGETRVFDARGPQGMRFTLAEPWSALLLDDDRVIHETTPIQPADPTRPAHRDTLVLTFRRHGFQGPTA